MDWLFNRRRRRWVVLAAILPGLFLLGGAVTQDGLFGQVTAAWVQALGAVYAIAAVVLMDADTRRRRALDEENALADHARALRVTVEAVLEMAGNGKPILDVFVGPKYRRQVIAQKDIFVRCSRLIERQDFARLGNSWLVEQQLNLGMALQHVVSIITEVDVELGNDPDSPAINDHIETLQNMPELIQHIVGEMQTEFEAY